jgi:hypothetical protein
MSNIYDIEPIISSNLLKIFNDELNIIFSLIIKKYPNICFDELRSIYNLDASKL